MIPYKAKVNHNPANGSYGDCFRTVIASILEVDPETVPHFFEDGNAELGYWRLDVWLAHNYGLRYVDTQYPGQVRAIDGSIVDVSVDEFATILGSYYPDIYLIVGGTTVRGINHVVIMRNGKIVSDPNPINDGLDGPTTAGYYVVGFLVSAKHKP